MKEKLFRPRYGIAHLVLFTWILTAIFANLAYEREKVFKRTLAEAMLRQP